MSKPKFTPGPWFFLNQTEYIAISGTDKYKRYVAEIDTRIFGSSQEEMKANARLIAAAPEMYSVLKEILGSHICQDRLDQVDLKKITGILKKIEGEK